MKWTNQRKAAVALLALAGSAFAFDRYVLGYEKIDLVGESPVATTLTGTAPEAAAPLAVPSLAKTITDRVAAAGTRHAVNVNATGDAFTVPPQWTKLVEKVQAASKAAPAPAKPADAPAFKLNMILSASGERASTAVINNQRVSIGEAIHGYTLVDITPAVTARHAQPGRPGSVTLEGPAGRLTVPMNAPGAPAVVAAPQGES